jgi:predicted HD superfamily hydrolase involved in NAD metabolism
MQRKPDEPVEKKEEQAMGDLTMLNPTEVRERLRREMEPDTFAHAERTAALARDLAVAHRVDPDRAELAGLLHDIADRYSERELLEMAERYGLELSLTEARIPKLLHARVGAEILRRGRGWLINDEEFLDAIAEHITGGVRMSLLSKVLFLADKLEPMRDRHMGGLDPVRELAKVNLDGAVLQLYAWRMDQLVQTGKPVDDKLVAARNQLIERTLASGR